MMREKQYTVHLGFEPGEGSMCHVFGMFLSMKNS